MRVATRAVVTTRHTYNLVDLPIAVAGKTGTAEFGVPDKYGRLPYHEWFVGYTPGNPRSTTSPSRTPSSRSSRSSTAPTAGNVATEVVKYYLMLHYGLIKRRPRRSTRTPGYVFNLGAKIEPTSTAVRIELTSDRPMSSSRRHLHAARLGAQGRLAGLA